MRFSAASDEPRSGDRCEPVTTILPGGRPPLPAQPYDIAAAEICRVSVPCVMTTPTAPSENASLVACSMRFQCLGRMSSDHMLPRFTARMRAMPRSSGTESSSSLGVKRALTAPVR
uniref:Uncharacterized protein n=1 Tax=uncultured marine group II/III euryarchaeote AD1000_29_A08 TaxID=1457748 RepID=A0A075FTR1_9EURY|nr:hypothetical protein [uncultured marine group II/III euryarchaeote AD1000_29_A08]